MPNKTVMTVFFYLFQFSLPFPGVTTVSNLEFLSSDLFLLLMPTGIHT